MPQNPMPQNRAAYLMEMLEKAIEETNQENPDKPPLIMPEDPEQKEAE